MPQLESFSSIQSGLRVVQTHSNGPKTKSNSHNYDSQVLTFLKQLISVLLTHINKKMMGLLTIPVTRKCRGKWRAQNRIWLNCRISTKEEKLRGNDLPFPQWRPAPKITGLLGKRIPRPQHNNTALHDPSHLVPVMNQTASTVTGSQAPRKLLHISEPQFPYLRSGNNSTSLIHSTTSCCCYMSPMCWTLVRIKEIMSICTCLAQSKHLVIFN